MIVIESVNHIGITVSNLEESVKFYRDLFDFEIIDKASAPGIAFIRVADISIGLYEVPGYKNPDNSKSRISFYVDEQDFDDAVEELEQMNIQIVYGPDNVRNGKVVVFLDPDGNQIELSYPMII
jgi:catechol 2,3-dioxygenase-like lactoylglutathione lyase family enzyme